MGIKVELYVDGGFDHLLTVSRFFGIYTREYRAMFCEEIGRFKFINQRNHAIIDRSKNEYLYDYLLDQLLKIEPKLLELSLQRIINSRRGLQHDSNRI